MPRSRLSARRSVPVEQVAFARFLPGWHGIDRRATLREALVPLQGWPCRSRSGSPRCCRGGFPTMRRRSSTSSAQPVSLVGRRRPRPRRGLSGEDAAVLGQPEGTERPGKARCTTGSGRRSQRAPSSGSTCSTSTSSTRRRRCPRCGSSSGPARSPTTRGRQARAGRYGVPKPERRPRRFSRRRATAITATQGRWSLTGRLFAGERDPRALASLLLERQGIVTRDGVRAEGIPGGYSAVYGETKALETLGFAAAATSSRASAARSSRSAAPWSGSGSCGRAMVLRGRCLRPGGGGPGAALRRGARVAEESGRAGRPGSPARTSS